MALLSFKKESDRSDSKWDNIIINTDLICTVELLKDKDIISINGHEINIGGWSRAEEKFNEIKEILETKMDMKDYLRSINKKLDEIETNTSYVDV